jgi:hypothetical protein
VSSGSPTQALLDEAALPSRPLSFGKPADSQAALVSHSVASVQSRRLRKKSFLARQ